MRLTEEYQYIGRTNPVGCPNGYGYYILVYAKASGDIATGRHTVSVKTRLACDANSSFYAYATSGGCDVAGVSAYSWSRQQIPAAYWGDSSALTEGGVTYPKWTELAEGSAVIENGFGVDKSVTITASWVMNSTSTKGWFPYTGVYAQGSFTVTLPGIAGASAITEASTTVLGTGCKIRWTPMSSQFSYRLTFSLGSWQAATGLICPNTAESFLYTDYVLPLEAARQVTDSYRAIMAVSLQTYADRGGTVPVGDASGSSFWILIPECEDTIPQVTMQISPVGAFADKGVYLQGLSRVQAAFSGSGKFGARITEYSLSVQSKAYGSPYLSGYLTKAEQTEVVGTAVDSRGFRSSVSQTITVQPYAIPKVLAEICGRADQQGNLSDSGTFLRVKAEREYSSVFVGDTQVNPCSLLLRYKLSDGADSSYSAWVTLLESEEGNIFDATVEQVALNAKNSYAIQLCAEDAVGNRTITTFLVGTEEIFMHRTKNALGLGKYAEGENLFDCGYDARFRGEVRLGEKGIPLEQYIKNIIAGG